jgi:hypothetical protein
VPWDTCGADAKSTRVRTKQRDTWAALHRDSQANRNGAAEIGNRAYAGRTATVAQGVYFCSEPWTSRHYVLTANRYRWTLWSASFQVVCRPGAAHKSVRPNDFLHRATSPKVLLRQIILWAKIHRIRVADNRVAYKSTKYELYRIVKTSARA